MRLAFIVGLHALFSASLVLAHSTVNADDNTSIVVPVDSARTTPDGAVENCLWSAAIEDDEGGPVMVASSCASDTEFGPALRLLCGEEVNIRFDGLGFDKEGSASSTLVLTSAGTSLDADVVFEEMDSAFAAYVQKNSPIIALLKTGDELGVTVKGKSLPPRTVSLKGSSAAIDTLISACN